MPFNLASSSIPPTISGMASVGPSGVPRFWATIWSDVLKTSIEPSTRRKHLAALDRLYAAVERQHGRDCLDWLTAYERTGDLSGRRQISGWLAFVRMNKGIFCRRDSRFERSGRGLT
ncbi:hypothetical protein [Agrobacterium tumefaciens]|uniref:hypothetical protein n=1 Tax=Agrobacterium tumefaciens TaxID=358 RepID=UPI001FEEB538|nr:hypothetical protein [Agrobacterium tumefaciens]